MFIYNLNKNFLLVLTILTQCPRAPTTDVRNTLFSCNGGGNMCMCVCLSVYIYKPLKQVFKP